MFQLAPAWCSPHAPTQAHLVLLVHANLGMPGTLLFQGMHICLGCLVLSAHANLGLPGDLLFQLVPTLFSWHAPIQACPVLLALTNLGPPGTLLFWLSLTWCCQRTPPQACPALLAHTNQGSLVLFCFACTHLLGPTQCSQSTLNQTCPCSMDSGASTWGGSKLRVTSTIPHQAETIDTEPDCLP